jgi:hypothetical protein
MGEAFEVADGEALGEGEVGQALLLSFGEGGQKFGMAGGEASVGDHQADGGNKIEQTEEVGDGGAVFTEAAGQFVLGEAELFHEVLVGGGPVDGVKVFALDVFNQGELGLGERVHVADDGREIGEAGEFGGAPTAFAGDELVLAVGGGADQDGLDQAIGLDAGGQLRQGGLIEFLSGLVGIGGDFVELDGADGDAGGEAGGVGGVGGGVKPVR